MIVDGASFRFRGADGFMLAQYLIDPSLIYNGFSAEI